MAGTGWHRNRKTAPHKGRSIEVEPIRKRSDVLKIMDNLRKAGNPRDYALFCVGVSVGLRATDLLKLRWENVLTDDMNIKTKITIREHKTRKPRTIALGKKARASLAALLPKPEKTGKLPDVDMDGFVFASRQEGRKERTVGMTIQRLNQLVKEWIATVDLQGQFGTHTLRKTFSYHILKQGSDIKALMKILNHSSPGVTLRYAGIEQEDMDKVVLKLNW